MNKIPLNFPIEVFNTEKVSDTLTKARLRIFYLGANRNGSYISEEFAEKLIKTLPYAPIKGIYDFDEEDYTDHGRKRSEGRIYGVVPENPNFEWVKHEDKDGVEREYATTDVILFTALYEEAEEIVGKAQSMELYSPSIKGDWFDLNGTTLYKYTEASFLGLQVLGESAEPCFQGSAFFSLDTLESQKLYILLTGIFDKLDQLTIGRNIEMANEYNPTFALSDSQKQDKIFQALNPEVFRYWVMDTYDEYAIVFDMEKEEFLKVSYTKDDTNNTVTVADDMITVYAEYVTKEEQDALAKLRKQAQADTYTAVIEEFNSNVEKINELQIELDNKGQEISTLNTDKETFENKIIELENQVEEFSNYKEEVEKTEKEAVIAKYSERLSEEILDSYTAKLADFTVESLERELAYALVKSDESIFTKEETKGYVPKPNINPDRLTSLINKYKK